MPLKKREIINIAASKDAVYALCNDGTLWRVGHGYDEWLQVPSIPQDDEEEDKTCSTCGYLNKGQCMYNTRFVYPSAACNKWKEKEQ
jgi:hypothetical protein